MDFDLSRILADATESEQSLITAIEELATEHGNSVYQQVFSELLDKKLDEDRAGRYWKEALVRWESQKSLRGAQQSVKTALFDYLQGVIGERLDSITDGLTGLYKQAYLTAHLKQVLSERQASSTPSRHAMVNVAIDGADDVRQALAPFEHDQAMRKIARTIREAVRKMDTAALLDDGSFGLLISGAGRNEAFAIAERVRHFVANESFAGEWNLPSGQLTVSCGIATCPEDGERGALLMAQAKEMVQLATDTGNLTTPRSAERRKGNRYPVCAMVEIAEHTSESYLPAMAYDISRHGMAIGCDLEMTGERVVSVRFREPYWPVNKDSRAIVRQAAPHGRPGLLRFGLEFIEPESELYQPYIG